MSACLDQPQLTRPAPFALAIVVSSLAWLGLVACGSPESGVDLGFDDTSSVSASSTLDPGASASSPTSAAVEPAGDVEQGVLAAFAAYRAALEARDGAAAVAVVTPNSIEWFDQIRNLALTATPEQLIDPATPLIEAATALRMRGELGAEVVALSTGEDLIALGVERGLVGSDVATTELDGVEELSSTEAHGLISGVRTFRFEDAGDGWRIDLQSAATMMAAEVSEAQVISLLSGGSATTRPELFALLAVASGTTWEDLSQPLV